MKTRKPAHTLRSGDIIYNSDGEKLGILLTDAKFTAGYTGGIVEFDVQLDDRTIPKCTGYLKEYDVEEWQPSQAV